MFLGSETIPICSFIFSFLKSSELNNFSLKTKDSHFYLLYDSSLQRLPGQKTFLHQLLLLNHNRKIAAPFCFSARADFSVLAGARCALLWKGAAAAGLCVPIPAGVARAFTAPALTALLPNLIPRNLWGNAATWNSSLFELTA